MTRNSRGVLARNKKALFEYEIVQSEEAGIALTGGEVRSVKSGLASIADAFVQITNGEAWLWGAHIPQWQFSGGAGYDPMRKRKLLLHRREIDTLLGLTKQKGMTLIPLKLYTVRGRVKIEVAVCRGRKKYERRERDKERQLDKELHKEKRKYMV